MLSILIPTYNYNITRLATELHRQAMEKCIDFELIVMEDGSAKFIAENKLIGGLENCKYIALKTNVGRSVIRNKLADEAKYEHLLFMDCDAEVCSPDFVAKYLTFCKEDCIVIGGTAYEPTENNSDYSLRLKYGRIREARPANERGKNNFATFNFLISKSIFNKVRFDERIRGYGHEDMLFGHELHQLGYEFIQIDNPLIHKGLDDNRTFIKKTEEATRNLYLLYCSGKYPFLSEESMLLKSFLKINSLRLNRLFALKFRLSNGILRWLLSRKSPSLFLYDWYKLLFLSNTSLTK
jgi:glycosyltransferase involved in cell wall biosynthesis